MSDQDTNDTKKGPPRGRVAQLLASDLVKKLKKANGESTLLRASDNKLVKTPRIPTGIFELDYAFGGGFPVGRISTLYGQKSSGKTTIFLKAIANAQRMCSNCWTYWDEEKGSCECGDYRETVCAFLDVEGTFDSEWAEKLGVDTDNLILDVPEYAEQALDIGEALLRSGNVDVLCLDSLAFLVPQKEIENSVTKDGMGISPRLIGKGVRKFLSAMNGVGRDTERRPTVFFTNQIRYKLGLLFGNPETTAGGQAPGFAASLECRLEAKKYEIHEATQKPISVNMKYRVDKNKTYGAKMAGEYQLMLTDTEHKKVGESCPEAALIKWGEYLEIIKRDGGYNCLGRTFPKKGDLVAEVESNREFREQLQSTLLPILLQL